jgi:outer membrane scaffolding protein for murein synthesis (MipA/OmpV family)
MAGGHLWAQDAPDPGKPLWEVALAGYGLYGPSYPGSSQSQFNFVPLPFPMYRGKFLRVGEDSERPLRGRVFRSDRIKLDIDMDLKFGSDSADIDARVGMPDLDPLLELGPELELKFMDGRIARGDMFLALQARGAMSFDGFNPDWRGLAFSPELRWVREFDQAGRRLKLRLTPTFATEPYMDYYYGVPASFATAQREAYNAKGGYLGTSLGLSLRQPLGKKLEVRAGFRLGFLQGARNQDSPLFTDDTTQAVYVAFLYRFWQSKRRAEPELWPD